MTGRYTTPGVYIEEVRLPQVISGVDTGTTAFVGRAARGPVDTPTLVTSFLDFERLFGGLWLKSDLGHSIRDFFKQGGRRAVVVRAHLPALDEVATLAFGRGSSRLVLEAISPGAWGSNLEATLDPLPRNRFDLTLTDRGTGRVETFTGLSLAKGSARRVDRVLEESAMIHVRLPLPPTLPPRLPVTSTATGGSDGRFGTSAYTGPGMRESGRGIYALDRADLVNLIVLPPYSTTTGVPRTVLTAAVAYARERRAMVILDPRPTWRTVDDAVVGAAGFFETRDAALYFPRLSGADPTRGGRLRDFAPSGAVAGMLARLDLNQGVWGSPAGGNATLSGATPSIPLTRADLDLLNPLGVNCIRAFPGRGTVVWGARTRAGAGEAEWKYVNLRRLALFLEESIRRGLEWAVFEPNDETLWTRVRGQVDDFLYGVFAQGAFPANLPQDAYFVRCGPDTMAQDDIDNGRLIILVGIAPIRPAEFVIFRIGQWRDDDD
jgi:phage tail sheath protein FI